jgi:asparagine synthase (glutamine-hydrolysing)
MCGILGTINVKIDEPVLALIKHRGPDDFGINSFSVNDYTIHLGQRRLAIIDLSPAGHQPMTSDCGQYAIIFNGEIYNHLILRKKLPKNIVYKGHSDTETILYYLIHFGINRISDFNGIFAFCFLDKKNKKIQLARDPFGVKPLYFFFNGKKMIFSSEIRPIKALSNQKTLNRPALASLLRLRYNASPDTLYTEIQKLKPGHSMCFDLMQPELIPVEKHFAQKPPKKIHDSRNNLIQRYGIELEKAVKRQLLADVEVGILLSGGIDSALVAALAQKHYNGKLKAFTIGFEGDFEEDEIADAAHTAQILGLEHHVKKITFNDFLSLIQECSRIVEEPLATTSMIPMYFLAQMASENVKVVLTGQGADEPLGGYTRYRSEIIRQKIPTFFRGIIKPVFKLLKAKNEQLVRGANAIGISDEIQRFLSVYEIFSIREIQQLIATKDNLSENRITGFYELLSCKEMNHPVEKMMAIDARMNLADDLLNYTDKITMNFSLECRVPMLDIELVHFIESLPVELKLNEKGGKIIHKEFAKTILPHEIINRPKKGFLSPTQKWFQEEMLTLKDILLSSNSNFSKIFNSIAVAEILNQHNNGYNKEKQIFLLLSIYYWMESNPDL